MSTKEIRERVTAAQALMEQLSEDSFSASRIDHLRVIIRLTFEFAEYLNNPDAVTFDRDSRASLKASFPNMEASVIEKDADKEQLRYVIHTIFASVHSFAHLTRGYHVLTGRSLSTVGGNAISLETLRERFVSMFNEFNTETKFQNKCRLLLDLFKLQIIFAGMLYD